MKERLFIHSLTDDWKSIYIGRSEYEDIKMSDITKEMGLSNGIPFVYFKTKESLFFCLLVREYEKRLDRLSALARETTIQVFEDFRKLVIRKLLELVDGNPMYIRLESMGTAILEYNLDADTMLKEKLKLYTLMQGLSRSYARMGF